MKKYTYFKQEPTDPTPIEKSIFHSDYQFFSNFSIRESMLSNAGCV